ncbi:uncharacterized protein LOC124157799 [Ischnura elegans]|uniref:uncharacterized protein LOC124157799 n=1 Tax=Ischnura elegans TaxID=197161 RepID=UPI001ED8873C|nr:uncharacterized protein LOC124157799 [Ischnura elegans]
MLQKRPSPTAPLPPLVLLLALFVCPPSLLATPLSLSHSNLAYGNGTCDERDSCSSGTKSLDWRDRNCLCDATCRTYDDCCPDSRYKPSKSVVGQFSCTPMRHLGGVYMKSSCPPGTSAEVRRRCEEKGGADKRDVVSIRMPVTSLVTNVTYSNAHCALCNGDLNGRAPDDFVVWTPRLECPSIQHFPFGSTTEPPMPSKWLPIFDEFRGVWGVMEKGRFHACTADPMAPPIAASLVRRCRLGVVSSCEPDWPDDSVGLRMAIKRRCGAPGSTAHVFLGAKTYRNAACAVCNRVPVHELSCAPPLTRSLGAAAKDFNPVAFSVLFDFGIPQGEYFQGGRGGVDPGPLSARLTAHGCPDETPLFDPFLRRCRDLLCPEMGQRWVRNRCVEVGRGYEEDEVDTTKDEPSSGVVRVVGLGGKAKERPKGKNFTTVHLHPSSAAIAMGYLTIIGVAASALFLIIHLVAFALLKELRTASGRNLASLCVALLIAYSAFFAGTFNTTPIGSTDVSRGCLAAATLALFGLLSAFCWSSTLAFDVWRTLRRATVHLHAPSDSVGGSGGKRRFALYSIFSWAIPAAIAAIALSLDIRTGGQACIYSVTASVSYRSEGNMSIGLPTTLPLTSVTPKDVANEHCPLSPVLTILTPSFGLHPSGACWFGRRSSLLILFAAPLGITTVANALLFILSARTISQATFRQSMAPTSAAPVKHGPPQAVRSFRLHLRLALLSGLSWSAGLLAGWLDIPPLWLVAVLLTSLHGVFLTVAFTCTSRVKRAMRRFLSRCRKRSSFQGSGSTGSKGPLTPASPASPASWSSTSSNGESNVTRKSDISSAAARQRTQSVDTLY